MNNDEVLTMDKTPYLSTTGYLFDQFLIFGYDKNEKKKDVSEELLEKIIDKCKGIKDKDRDDKKPIENFCIIDAQLPLLYAVSSKADGAMLNPDFISSIIFPNDIKIHYQIGDIPIENLNIQSHKNIVFLINSDSTAGDSKNIFNGYAYVYYEKYKSTVKIPNDNQSNAVEQNLLLYIPKAFCFISHYPFFAHYSLLSQKILELFAIKDLEIPIEIILHNLITYTPAPIGMNVKINIFPNEDLSKYAIGNQKQNNIEPQIDNKNDQAIVFNCLSGYPLCDFNLSELFNILPLEHIVEILIFTFLEIDVLIFSKDLEVLNLVLYIFSILSYPVNDTPYLWHIVSVSPRGLTETEKGGNFVGKPFTTMLGINCTYSESLELSKFSKSTFVVDIDNSELLFKCYPDKLDQDEYQECQQIGKLHAYIEKIIMSQDQPKSLFEDNLIRFVEEIGRISNKAEILNPNEGKDFYNFYKGISYQFNTKIQNIFFTFILNLLKNHLNTNIINKKQDNLSMSMTSDFNSKNIIEEEKVFNTFFVNSTKYAFYYNSFLKDHSPLDCYRISLYFSEEFIQLKNSNAEEYIFQHFFVIDNFYMSNVRTIFIDYSEFYSYYINDLNVVIFDNIRKNKLVTSSKKVIKKRNGKVIKYQYHYNRTELDDSVSFQYMHASANLTDNHLNKIFPYYSLAKEPSLIRIAYRDIVEPIEFFYLKNKSLTLEDIITFSIILFYLFTISFMNLDEFAKQLDFIYKLILQQKFFVRKYIAMIITIYNHHMIHLKENESDYNHIIVAYKKIKELITIKQVYLNEELSKMIALFEKDKLYDSISKTLTFSLLNESNALNESKSSSSSTGSPDKKNYNLNASIIRSKTKDQRTHQDSKETKDTSFDIIQENKSGCTISLDANRCKEHVYNEEFIGKICSNVEYEGDIKIRCDTCAMKLDPVIKVFVSENKSIIECEIYSPLKIYRTCTFLMMNWLLVGMKEEAFDKKMLRKLMINLLFYNKIKLTLSSSLIPISTFSVVEKK